MYGVLQRIEHHANDDHQKRLTLSFDKLFARERGTPLNLLFNYWRDVTAAGVVEDIAHFQPAKDLPLDAARWISWIDTSTVSPLDYTWRDHVYAWQGRSSGVFKDASGTRIRDYGVQRHGRFCATEYHRCKALQRPFYHEIEQWIGSEYRHYLRLLLPIRERDSETSRLVYVCRRI